MDNDEESSDFSYHGAIARGFDLPERRAKLRGLFCETVDQQVYCVCKSTNSTAFMICCDECEDWFHGNCVDITPRDSKRIMKFYCPSCQAVNPSLKTCYKRPKGPSDVGLPDPKLAKKKIRKIKPVAVVKLERYNSEGAGHDAKPKAIRKTVRDHEEQPRQKRKYTKSNKPRANRKKHSEAEFVAKTEPRRPSVDDEQVRIKGPARQCYGPGCTKHALDGSKYCSEECGMKLASERLHRLLPSRLYDWSQTPSIVTMKGHGELEGLRSKIEDTKQELQRLEDERMKLERLIDDSKLTPITDDDPDEEDVDDQLDFTVDCTTCGMQVNPRAAIRHMHRCFAKHEANSTYGSAVSAKVIGATMFCDVYNAKDNTYCKRLKVMCPEHFKDPKNVSDTEVCGFPLTCPELLIETGDFCSISKRRCYKHPFWEKLRRAELDLQMVHQWLKIDDLIEQDRSIRLAAASRVSVLSLLLHSTTVA